MSQTSFSAVIEIAAPPTLVWPVMVDVERWPEWTASVSRIVPLTPGALRAGSRVRIHQPKLPSACWCVIDLKPGVEFTWVSTAPGVKVTARHIVEPVATGSRVTLSIHYEGLFGPWLAWWTRHLNERYLRMEAEGLKARCGPASA